MIPVPEPSFGWMLGLGAAALLLEHGIGVRKKAIELWELDASAFEEDSDEIGVEES